MVGRPTSGLWPARARRGSADEKTLADCELAISFLNAFDVAPLVSAADHEVECAARLDVPVALL